MLGTVGAWQAVKSSRADPNAAMEFADTVVAARCRKLAKHRSLLQGLHAGRGEEVMGLVERARCGPALKGMLCTIQSDSVYTAA